MPKTPTSLARMRDICLALPDTKETPTWGQPHFRVGDKIFAGWGTESGKAEVIGFKLEMDHAAALVHDDPRCWKAPYVGHKGWVSMDAGKVKDWEEVRALVHESYGLIAPKRSLAKLSAPAATPRKKAPARKSSSPGTARRKTTART